MAPDLKSFFRDGKLTDQAAHFLSDETIEKYGIFNKKYIHRFLNKFQYKSIENIGYRDNMITTFVLTAQIAAFWADTPKKPAVCNQPKDVDIIEN